MTDVSKVKGCLSQWRELVILADGLLGWEKDFYPALIAAAVTLKFVFVWWWDPTLLTFISITGKETKDWCMIFFYSWRFS